MQYLSNKFLEPYIGDVDPITVEIPTKYIGRLFTNTASGITYVYSDINGIPEWISLSGTVTGGINSSTEPILSVPSNIMDKSTVIVKILNYSDMDPGVTITAISSVPTSVNTSNGDISLTIDDIVGNKTISLIVGVTEPDKQTTYKSVNLYINDSDINNYKLCYTSNIDSFNMMNNVNKLVNASII